jgi:hypothetical protein
MSIRSPGGFADIEADAPHYRPPYEQPRFVRRGGAGLIGDASPVTAERYICPHPTGDDIGYRPDIATPIPACPTHHRLLTQG